jgi:hypothetical protein
MRRHALCPRLYWWVSGKESMRTHWFHTSRLGDSQLQPTSRSFRIAALSAAVICFTALPAIAQHGGGGHASGGGGGFSSGHSSGGFSGGSSAPHFSSAPSGSSAPHYSSAPSGYASAPRYGSPAGLRQPGVRGTYAPRTYPPGTSAPRPASGTRPPLASHYGTTSNSSHPGAPVHTGVLRTNSTVSSLHSSGTNHSGNNGNHGRGWNNRNRGYNGYGFPYGGYFGPIYNPYLFYPWLDADLSWDFWHNTGDSDDAIAAASVGADAYGPAPPDSDSDSQASQPAQSQSAQSAGDPSQNEALSQAELEAQQAEVERATIAADGPRVSMVQGDSTSPGMSLVYKDGQQQLIDNYVVSRSGVTITDRAGHITTIPTTALNVVATNQANAALGNGLVLPTP